MPTDQQDNNPIRTFVDLNGDHVQAFAPISIGPQPELGTIFLIDGSNRSMNVDGSGTAVNFNAGPSTTDEVWLVHHLRIMIRHVTMESTDFGGISAIGTGCLLRKLRGASTVDHDILGGQTWVDNQDIYSLADCRLQAFASDEILSIDFDFKKISGSPIRLLEASTEIIQLRVQDNLTSLTEMYATISASIETIEA